MKTTLSIAIAFFVSLLVGGCCEPLPPKKPTVPEPIITEPDGGAEEPEPAPEAAFVLLPSDDSNTVSFRFLFEAGSANDPEGQKGMTALCAFLMANGGTTALTYPELTEALFPMAADISVNVDRDQTVFFGRVHKDEAARYYELIRDVLVSPRMEEKDFQRIRDQVKTDLTLSLKGNDDEELGKAALHWLMYEGHPYGPPVQGIASDLDGSTLEAVKEQREKNFCASRLTIGLAGAYGDDLIETIRKDMASLPDKCELREPTQAASRPEGRRVLIVDKPSAQSTAISIGFPIDVKRGDPDYASLKLVEAYFGQPRTFSGKLQKELRVSRGFNYGNYAYAEYFEQLGWSRIPMTNVGRDQQCFTIWLRPVKNDQSHFALRLALDELENLVREGLTEQDLEKTRAFMKRYYLTFAQTEEQRLGYALDDAFYGSQAPYFTALFRDLDALDAAKVNEAIKRHLTADALNIAMVSGNAAGLEADIVSDKPSPVTYESEKPADILARDKVIEKSKLGIVEDAVTIIPVSEIFE